MQQLKKYEMERRRGMIVYLLNVSRPKPVELGSLLYLLDARNYPVTRHRLAEDLDFLRDAGLVRLMMPSSESPLNDVQQEKHLHRFAESDGDNDNDFCVKLTNKGINFQDGQTQELGVLRVG
jgi:hypothetical protein